MERTALETTGRDSITGQQWIQFETIQNATLQLGGGEGAPDRETPTSRFCICIDTKAFDAADKGFTRDVHVQIWITPTQIAALVKQYFADMLWHTSLVYRQQLERLLRKRWSVMTSSVYKQEYPGCSRLEPYHKTKGV